MVVAGNLFGHSHLWDVTLAKQITANGRVGGNIVPLHTRKIV